MPPRKPRPATKRTARLEFYPAPELLRAIDAWRREQPDLPSRAEAVRRLLAAALRPPRP